MINTTLCYITSGDQVLMLHRTKKENDLNKDKWIGIGGKFEANESPDECLLREVYEETGLTLNAWKCHGVITFLTDGGSAVAPITATKAICSGSAGIFLTTCPSGKEIKSF